MRKRKFEINGSIAYKPDDLKPILPHDFHLKAVEMLESGESVEYGTFTLSIRDEGEVYQEVSTSGTFLIGFNEIGIGYGLDTEWINADNVRHALNQYFGNRED